MFAAVLTLVALSSIGVPGTNGFIGEFLVLVGSFSEFPILTAIATTAVIFSAAYLLWAIQRIIFNPLDRPENEQVTDMNRRELLLMAPLVAAIIWLGVYAAPVLRRMQPAAERFVQLVQVRTGQPLTRVGELP
jgi:NADH-quinone oxidoreductase subunit M